MTITDGAARVAAAGAALSVRRTAWAAAAVFAVLVLAFWFCWPVGVVLGLAVGVAATARIALRMHRAPQPERGELFDDDEDLRQEVRRLRVRCGDDWPAFVDAVALVVAAQSASAIGLQRGLGVPHGQAQHLLRLLEREGFVGPPRGTAAREVRVDRERADELQELLQV